MLEEIIIFESGTLDDSFDGSLIRPNAPFHCLLLMVLWWGASTFALQETVGTRVILHYVSA